MKILNLNSLFLSFFLLFLSLQIQAQSPSVKVGDPVTLDKDVLVDKVFSGNYKGSYIVYRTSSGFYFEYSVAYFNEDLSLVKKFPITTKYGKPEKKAQMVVQFNDKIHFIYAGYDKKERKTTVVARAMNMTTLTLSNEEIKLGEYPTKYISAMETYPELTVSSGWKADDYKKTQNYHSKTNLYNRRFELIKTETKTYNISEITSLGSQHTSSIGGIHNSKIIALPTIKTSNEYTYTTKIGTYKKKKVTGNNSIIISKKGTEKIEVNINPKNYPIWGVSMKEISGKIKGYAYYENEERDALDITIANPRKLKGFYTFEIDPISKQLVKDNYNLIPDKSGKNPLIPSKFIIQNDGGGYFLLEDKITHKSIDEQGKTYTSYTYGTIQIVKFDPNGNIVKTSKIKKRQRFTDTRKSSYTVMLSNSKLYIILNDNPENLSNSNGEKTKTTIEKNSKVYIYTVDKELNIKRQPLDKTNKIIGDLQPMFSDNYKTDNLKGLLKISKKAYQLFEISNN